MNDLVCDVIEMPKRGEATEGGEIGLTECARIDDVAAAADDADVVEPVRWKSDILKAGGLGFS